MTAPRRHVRRPAGRALPLALVLALSLLRAEAAVAQPRVRLIATGGTIANHLDRRLSAEALVGAVPGIDRIARVEPETFATNSSLALGLDDWLRLARRIGTVLARNPPAGVVVTGGTDTLEELAWFLDLAIATDHPIVLTGAMHRPGTPESDGPDNLRRALQVAVADGSRGRGALVVFGTTVHEARHATKVSTTALNAFSSGAAGPVGTVDDSGLKYRRPRRRGHRLLPAFDPASVRRLPRVDVLLTYQQAPGDLVDAAVAAGARGLVIAAAGAGSVTAAQSSAILDATRRGIPVVVASRVLDGVVRPRELASSPRLLAAGGLSPVKARVLLMMALAVDAPLVQVFPRLD